MLEEKKNEKKGNVNGKTTLQIIVFLMTLLQSGLIKIVKAIIKTVRMSQLQNKHSLL